VVEILQGALETWSFGKSWFDMRVAYVLAVAHIPAVRLPGPPEAN
jgi:hypothetical protein